MLFLSIFRFSEEKLQCWISVVNLNTLSSKTPLIPVTHCAQKSQQQSCKIQEQKQCQEGGKILTYKGERGTKS